MYDPLLLYFELIEEVSHVSCETKAEYHCCPEILRISKQLILDNQNLAKLLPLSFTTTLLDHRNVYVCKVRLFV